MIESVGEGFPLPKNDERSLYGGRNAFLIKIPQGRTTFARGEILVFFRANAVRPYDDNGNVINYKEI